MIQRIKQHIPNAVTCLNLVCGIVGIILAFKGNMIAAPYLVWTALCFDFLDGFLARLLKVHNKIGKDLDSLADMVTFGVFPTIIMFNMMEQVACTNLCANSWTTILFPYSALLIAVMSAMRLAKFNVDTRQVDGFIGVPTPTNAMFITALPLLAAKFEFYNGLMTPYVLLAITLVTSYLLVSELPLLSLKFKHFKFEGINVFRYIFIIPSITIYVLFPYATIQIIIVWYVIVSIIYNLTNKGEQ